MKQGRERERARNNGIERKCTNKRDERNELSERGRTAQDRDERKTQERNNGYRNKQRERNVKKCVSRSGELLDEKICLKSLKGERRTKEMIKRNKVERERFA